MTNIKVIDGIEIVPYPTADEIDGMECEFRTEPTDPDGWRIYSDVLDPETVQYIFKYARENPDDDYAQYRVETLFYSNNSYRGTHGKNIPGFEDRFYEEFSHLNPDHVKPKP